MFTTTEEIYEVPPSGPDRRLRAMLLALGLVVVLAVAVAVGYAIATKDDPEPQGGPSAAPPATSAPVARPTPSGVETSAPPAPAFAYQPLWPFSGTAEAAAWQRAYRSGGHQPWHLDPGLTAVSFSVQYLGFTAVDEVVDQTVVGREAWVGVGYELPDGSRSTAAVVHLARIGSGVDAPWEVVGTRDSTLTLATPMYAAAVSSPLVVGGRITGVDESLRVQVRSLGGPVRGSVGGIPTGGDNAPWSARVTFTAPSRAVLTVVVSTGGHVAAVERFAITAVRVAVATG